MLAAGWKELERRYRATLKAKPDEDETAEIMFNELDFAEGQQFDNPAATVTEHDTTPPKQHTEASLLSTMERTGNENTDPKYRAPAKSQDFWGKGGATEQNEYPALDGCSKTEFATTQRLNTAAM